MKKNMKKLLAFLCAVVLFVTAVFTENAMNQAQAEDTLSTETSTEPTPVELYGFENVTLNDFVHVSTGSAMHEGEYVSGTDYTYTLTNGTSFDKKLFTANVKFTTPGGWWTNVIRIGGTNSNWGIGVGVNSAENKLAISELNADLNGNNSEATEFEHFKTAEEADVTSFSESFLLQIGYEYLANDTDGEANDVRVLVYVNGTEVLNKVVPDCDMSRFGNYVRFYIEDANSKIEVEAVDLPVEPVKLAGFTNVDVDDFVDSTGITMKEQDYINADSSRLYHLADNSNSFNKKLFTAYVKFSHSGADIWNTRLHIGGADQYKGLGVYTDGSTLTIKEMNGAGSCLKEGLVVAQVSKDTVNLSSFFGNPFLLQVGYEYIDEDSVRIVYFGASADYPWYKQYHKKDISDFCSEDNEIKIDAWYPGRDSQTYMKDEAGLFFAIEQNGMVLLESGSHILSRMNNNYRNGYCKSITSQLGFSFYYNNAIANRISYQPSVERRTIEKLYLRKTGEIRLGKRTKTNCVKNERGYLIDMGEETVGFLDLEFISPTEQDILISYGEHLVDGNVPRIIKDRDFSVEFRAKQGENSYLNPFRRLAGRYLQVECEYPLEVTYIGLRPTDRKVVSKKKTFEDGVLQTIYDVSVNTLKKCMHEHYEDCPWREQAMYTLDSRNQMLCGYYAFKGYSYQRENLLFIAKGQREDGLLSLCFPAGMDIPIPFFSLVYLMQVSEYVEHTGDISVLKKVKPLVDKILEAFRRRKDETGLIANFPYPYWNFYEWSDASNNEYEIYRKQDDVYIKQYDLILNCMYVMACSAYESLFGDDLLDKEMVCTIHNTFYNQEKGLYKLSTNGENYSQLGNSFAILIGLGNEVLADKIINDTTLIPVTLSMNTFYYDALLSVSNNYTQYVIDDIKTKYSKMLAQGATTFWETEIGWEDFDGAGSLCHGWSSIPVYYLSKLIK